MYIYIIYNTLSCMLYCFVVNVASLWRVCYFATCVCQNTLCSLKPLSCVCVCVCVLSCEGEKERKRETEISVSHHIYVSGYAICSSITYM